MKVLAEVNLRLMRMGSALLLGYDETDARGKVASVSSWTVVYHSV